MKKITIAGQHILALGQGTWNMGDHYDTRRSEMDALRFGVDNGLTLIDTAEMYGNGRSESLVGEAIKDIRNQVVLVSKVIPSNASLTGTIKACEQSLKRLQTDYLDLYLLHWQGIYPFEETIEAFEILAKDGKIKFWGVSNLDISEMQYIQTIKNGHHCNTDQVLYNLTRRGIEYDLLPWCQKNALPIMAYSPIEQNRLLEEKVVVAIANKHQATPAQIALAWILQNEDVIPIPKASTIAHVQENLGCFDIQLSEEDNILLNNIFPSPNSKQGLEMI
ncbi:aldo/keto reductase [Rhizosphaericola mali]|uniref:Aldo/keto reductase n=1 Tax=Rhizosphaericola mali TaxID=2545455 RepID=A0A5P2FYP5_9BACT|nr:aldo/keto reductase [Rhizosphaericola mali]QES88626.1 aldo/keto reductase [Rhizosphaericola mali]